MFSVKETYLEFSSIQIPIVKKKFVRGFFFVKCITKKITVVKKLARAAVLATALVLRAVSPAVLREGQ